MAFRTSTGVMTDPLKSLMATDKSLSSETKESDEGKLVRVKLGAVWIWLVDAIVDETYWWLGILEWHWTEQVGIVMEAGRESPSAIDWHWDAKSLRLQLGLVYVSASLKASCWGAKETEIV